jgi:IS30 family transposase
MARDINLWARQCVPCQTSNTHTHISPPPAPIPIPSRRFSHIHIDLVGPLPSSQGHTHILTVMDRTTRWAEAVPLPSTSATACAQALCSAWISPFGLPHTINSDRGSQFVSSIWWNLSSFLNISHITTTAFHPQSNGLIEHFHRRLKATL